MSRATGDPTLDGRVQKIVEEYLCSASPVTVDSILQSLLSKHKEYVRKPQLVLRKAVSMSIERARAKLGAIAISAPAEGIVNDVQNDTMEDNIGDASTAPSLNDTIYSGLKSESTKVDTELPPPAKGAVKGVKRKRAVDGENVKSSKAAPAPQDNEGMGPPQWELPPYIRPAQRYSDIGGLSSLLVTLRQVVEYPLLHPEMYAHLGVEPPRGVLLHGPPGTGKTLLAHAIAGELGVYFRSVAGPELVGGLSGESENRLRLVFEDVRLHAPAILFIDELDAIAPKRESSSRGMERRMVAQLLACIDGLAPSNTGGKTVLILAATNRPDSLDSGLRRAGRFDREVSVPIPDEEARLDILRVLTKGMRLEPVASSSSSTSSALDLRAISRLTPGYVGADLAALAKEAAASAIDRVLATVPGAAATALLPPPSTDEAMGQPSAPSAPSDMSAVPGLPLAGLDMGGVYITHADFLTATKRVQPSALREGFATAPSVTWNDVGALRDVRQELEMAIVQPLRRPEVFAALGLRVPAGVLLYGPPGCGKTLLAKAIASESNANFISIKGPELLDKYVGESERAVRQVFQRARSSAPCIVFFDELDSLAPRRGGEGGGGAGGGGSSSNVSERVVNQLLTELDGLDVRRDVFVVAATNRPDIIDPAMLRPGRLDKLLYVPLPTPAERGAILRTHVRTMPLDDDVDVEAIAADERCARFSGADLAALAREAAVAALKEFFQTEVDSAGGALPGVAPPGTPLPRISMRHFGLAFSKVQPSVSVADEKQYNSLRTKLRRVPIARDNTATSTSNAAATPTASGAASGGAGAEGR